jgi:biopolymer transport protein ExbB
MKKLFAFIAVFGMLVLGASFYTVAQEETTDDMTVEQTDSMDMDEAMEDTTVVEEEIVEDVIPVQEEKSLHKQIKLKFIEGGPGFMGSVLLCLILGLALAIERIIYLNLASTNTKKLLLAVEESLNQGGVEAAKDVCRNTKGPVASIFYQGLDRMDEGIEVVEKSVVSYGSVQMGLLEKGISWIGLFISIAPMLGFMGTVIGMIGAFDSIQAAGDISPTVVAGGIKVALITTVSGLIVAVILQVFYNYIISKIDGIVGDMEDASISLVDILVKYNLKK